MAGGCISAMIFRDLQVKVGELVSDKSATVADYLAIAKALPHAGEVPAYFRKVRAAFLSSYTIQGLPEVLRRGQFFIIYRPKFITRPTRKSVRRF